MPSRRRNAIDPILLQRRLLVHEQHGVGKYVEMVRRTIIRRRARIPDHRVRAGPAGSAGDRLFVPTDALDQVTKYVAARGPSLKIGLGGADWPRRRVVRARRQGDRGPADPPLQRPMATKGSRFSRDTPCSASSRTRSPTSRRPDQLAAIDEVKADMEKPLAMDRIICGDVGYGKTEVAVRRRSRRCRTASRVAVLSCRPRC